MIPFTPPQFEKTSFNCPHCNAYAKQHWSSIFADNRYHVPGVKIAFCDHCNNYSIWNEGILFFPDVSSAPLPNPDLPEDIKTDYIEARSILNKSPRGAAALLRLCIQKLCKHLKESGRDLNNDIGNLVKKGLPTKIQQSLDIVRVIGNNAVHPGTIDLNDSPEIASTLFYLVNVITQVMITQPKGIEALYNALPKGAIKGIEERDK